MTRSARPGGRGLEPLEGTVGAALDEGGRSLARARVESPRLTAELLLARVLEIDRVGVLTHPEAPLTERAAAELTQAQTAWQHANVLNRVGDALDALAVYAAEADRLA